MSDAWRLVNFEEEFDKWVERCEISDQVCLIVLEWVVGRSDDPYAGATREPQIGNLWRCRIPETLDERGEIAYCVYYVYEQSKIIYCRGFSMNSLI